MYESIKKLTDSVYSNMTRLTDIGEVNARLLKSELDKRNIKLE